METEPSGKLFLRQEEFRSVRSLHPVSEAYIVFCNSALPWITPPRNSKQACHAHCRVVVRKSMALEGSIVSPNKKISFKVFMYINTWTYLHKYFSWRANGLFPYDDIRHLFCHFTSFLPSRCTSFFPTLLEFSPRFFDFLFIALLI